MSSTALRFTITKGSITAIYKLDDGVWKLDRPDANEVWSINGAQVIKTETEHGVTKTTTYTDGDGDGTYSPSTDGLLSNDNDGHNVDDHVNDDITGGVLPRTSSDSASNHLNDSNSPEGRTSDGSESYRFDVQNGSITQAYELENSVWQKEILRGNETLQFDGLDVLKVEARTAGKEITRYSDADGDGLFIKVSEQWEGAGSDTGPKMTQSLRHVHTDGDDLIAVSNGTRASGGLGNDTFVVRDTSHLEIGDFEVGHDKITFDTGLGITSIDQLLGLVTGTERHGDNYVVHFGENTSITLVGVDPASLNAGDIEILS